MTSRVHPGASAALCQNRAALGFAGAATNPGGNPSAPRTKRQLVADVSGNGNQGVVLVTAI